MSKIENILEQKIRDDIESHAILYQNEMFTYFDSGLTRHVFVNADKTTVIKILIDGSNKDYNLEEADIYDNASPNMKKELAETKLVMNGTLIEQEFCSPIKYDDRKLTIPQMMFAASCRDEVGWNKDGELVCFDLDEYKKY